MERAVVENVVLHQSCFLCKHCNKKLSLHNYGVYLGSIFCKDHHTLLMKSKENISGSLNGKQNQGDQLNTSIMSNPATTAKTQYSKVNTSNFMKEYTGKKLMTDPRGNFDVSGQRIPLSDSQQDSGRLRIHWPPLQKYNTGVNANPNRPVVTQWPPFASGSSFQTNKPTLIKLDLAINNTQKQNAKGENVLQINRRTMGSFPITKPGSNVSTSDMPGEGRRKLQELTQKLKTHNGNAPKGSREVQFRRWLAESTSRFPHPNSVISSVSNAPPLFPATHLKVLKVIKPTTQKPVSKVNRGFDVSCSMKPVNDVNVEHFRQSSTNMLIPLSKDMLQTGISKTDPNLSLPVVSTNHLIGKAMIHQDSADLATFMKEDLDFQEASETDTDYSTDHKEKSGYVPTCNSESGILTTEANCSHMNENLFLPESTINSKVKLNDSERLTFGRMKEVDDVESKRLVLEATNEEYHVKYPTESHINITVDNKPPTDIEYNRRETEEITQSCMVETDMSESKYTLQEITTERNSCVGEAEFSVNDEKETETHSQEMESAAFGQDLSNEFAHQHPIPTRNDVILKVIRTLEGSENLSSVCQSLGANTSAAEQPDQSATADPISPKIHKSTEMLVGTNLHNPAPPENAPKIPKANRNHRKSSHYLPSVGKNVTTVQSMPEVMTSKVTVGTTQVQENTKSLAGKDHSLKSSGFGKNTFSRLFPLDSKESKSSKELTIKGQVGSKTQSALGKIFGLSLDNSRKEEKVTKSHQKPSKGSIKNDSKLSQSNTGLEDTKHITVTSNETAFISTETLEGLRQSDKSEGSSVQPESSEIFLSSKLQARNVHIEELEILTMRNATDSDESMWITASDNPIIPGNESDAISLPGQIQLSADSKSIGLEQPNSESHQTKELEKHFTTISSVSLIIQEDPASVSLSKTSPERQETLQSDNIETNELSNHCLQSTPQNDGSVGHFRNGEQEKISNTDNQDFLELETSLPGATFQTNVQKSELYDIGVCNENIQLYSSTTMLMSQTEHPSGLGSLESDTINDSLGKVINSKLSLDIATDSTTDMLCDTEGSHSFLNLELAELDEAWPPNTGDNADTSGLCFKVGNSTADPDKPVEESKM